MKTQTPKPASIAKTRWAAYAAAGVSTALASNQSADAAIHYSGRLNALFGDGHCAICVFPLDPGHSFKLYHTTFGILCLGFVIDDSAGAFRGRPGSGPIPYVSRLDLSQRVSQGPFTQGFGFMACTLRLTHEQWAAPGYGFIGFRFNIGAGFQYGWIRIRVDGGPRYNGKLLDYAYADPGEPIRTGQTSNDQQSPDQGSLGWLALGAVGLLAWRKRRSRSAGSS